MIDSEDIARRYAALQARLTNIAQRAGRDPKDVTVLAVTKGRTAGEIAAVVACGVPAIGENYVQEARAKFGALPHVARHFIGHVQTNKAAEIARTFDVVESVDRFPAAEALSRAACRTGKALRVLLQVNLSPAERFGCSPHEAPGLARRIRELPCLALDGVMAIGPLGAGEAAIARAFEIAAEVRTAIGGAVLSIGMSDDWEAAVHAGSTEIRIGTALFGPRPTARASKMKEPEAKSA